ncbi:ABC transporter substrate-binding protein [Neorhizobium sp. NCHU2750]|uniref:ABC transporter substrate-binding protein n=1 Tax=Neorhizobium sp. NCHU2750 TaxID=1825976 RepID=UPI0013C442FB
MTTGKLGRRGFLSGMLCLAASDAFPQAKTPPSRVATPDRAATQTVLSLGVLPAVTVAPQFYRGMGSTPQLPSGIPSCGDPTEPNLEVLQRYGVDLVVTGTIAADVQAVLRRVAPVFPLEIYTGQVAVLDRAKSETARLADFLRLSAQGRAAIDAVDDILTTEAARIAGLTWRPMFLVGLSPDGRNMTVYGRNSIMYDVMDHLGLENAWTGPTNAFGFASAGIEELAGRPDAELLHIEYGRMTDAALAKLASSPLWNSLPMVRAGRVFRIPRFEVFGALPAAPQFARLLTDTLLEASRT